MVLSLNPLSRFHYYAALAPPNCSLFRGSKTSGSDNVVWLEKDWWLPTEMPPHFVLASWLFWNNRGWSTTIVKPHGCVSEKKSVSSEDAPLRQPASQPASQSAGARICYFFSLLYRLANTDSYTYHQCLFANFFVLAFSSLSKFADGEKAILRIASMFAWCFIA